MSDRPPGTDPDFDCTDDTLTNYCATRTSGGPDPDEQRVPRFNDHQWLHDPEPECDAPEEASVNNIRRPFIRVETWMGVRRWPRR
jgi:hypothetical protein